MSLHLVLSAVIKTEHDHVTSNTISKFVLVTDDNIYCNAHPLTFTPPPPTHTQRRKKRALSFWHFPEWTGSKPNKQNMSCIITYANVLDHGDKNSPKKHNKFQVLTPLHLFLKQTMVFRLLLKKPYLSTRCANLTWDRTPVADLLVTLHLCWCVAASVVL